MDLSPYRHADRTTVSAPPETVWAVVADITRMGELSPVCTGGDWDDAATGPVEGAWFTGHNTTPERTWSTRCRVEAVEPGKVFRFTNHGPGDEEPLVRWGYDFAATAGGTEVTESWEVLPAYETFLADRLPDADPRTMLEAAVARTRDGIAATLAALKQRCEG